MNVFLVGFGDTSQSDSHHPAGKTWGRESATRNEDSIGYFEAFPCPVTVSKRFSYYTDPPKWCTMKSRSVYKRITAVWEHVGNFGLQSPSIQLNCHTSQFQDVRFSWLRPQSFLCLRQPLDWHRKKI